MPQTSVAILLCTYNGAEYLAEQLRSIEQQTHHNWTLYVSDDGSSDATLDLLESHRQRLGHERIVILQGPRQGFAKNFLSLVKNPAITADYYAFCDQDDRWHEDRLERGVRRLSTILPERPAVFCSRTRLINAQGQVMGFSPLFAKTPGFRNALVQSLAGANTMLLNGAARGLLASTPPDAHVVSHDWLTYLLVSGCGGAVIYDPEPTLDYRQHGANLIGSNATLADRWLRIRMMLTGTFRDWNRHNLYAISGSKGAFTKDSIQALENFITARQKGLLGRVWFLLKAGVYRQTLIGNIGLLLAASLRRI